LVPLHIILGTLAANIKQIVDFANPGFSDTNKLMAHTYKYPRPMVTVDAVVFRRAAGRLEVLVVRRAKPPFKGKLALPGGFLEMDEDLLDGVKRELFEETGLKNVRLEQLGAFGKPGRDPRGRTVSIAFFGTIEKNQVEVRGGDDASEALWIPALEYPSLAFDHREILRVGLKRLKGLT
jgi:8-oxo-dGTP diphosphatase